MLVRVGFLGVAHMHAWGYAHALKAHPEAELAGVWDRNAERGRDFAAKIGASFFEDKGAFLAQTDAVVNCAENKSHSEYGKLAAESGKHILCEKPLVTTQSEGEELLKATTNVKLMTAFACRYSPSYQRLKQRVKAGDIGEIKAICATNRGTCPFDWFVDKELSGGGAIIDHTVHVADLLRDLLGEEPETVTAKSGSNMYGQEWEDTAMLTLEYPSGVFATLDASWSRPKSYKTWGDVTMNVVGEKGVLELDMFGQQLDHYRNSDMRHGVVGWGSDLDSLLVADFLKCIKNDTPPPISGEDGIAASRVAWLAYES